MLTDNRIVNENIDKNFSDFTNQNFNPIGLFFNNPGVIFKLRYWQKGSPYYDKGFLVFSKKIPVHENRYLQAVVRYVENLRTTRTGEDLSQLEKTAYSESFIRLKEQYESRKDSGPGVDLDEEDYDNIIYGICNTLTAWKKRNKSKINEIGDVWLHFNRIYSKGQKEDIFIPNKFIDAIRAVIDPGKYHQDLECIDLYNRDVRPYIVRSPVYKNDFMRHFNSDEERRVSDLVFKLPDRNPYDKNIVWRLYCNRGRSDNIPLTMSNMFSN